MLLCFEKYDFEKPEKCMTEIDTLNACAELHSGDPVSGGRGWRAQIFHEHSLTPAPAFRIQNRLRVSGSMQCEAACFSTLRRKELVGSSSESTNRREL